MQQFDAIGNRPNLDAIDARRREEAAVAVESQRRDRSAMPGKRPFKLAIRGAPQLDLARSFWISAGACQTRAVGRIGEGGGRADVPFEREPAVAALPEIMPFPVAQIGLFLCRQPAFKQTIRAIQVSVVEKAKDSAHFRLIKQRLGFRLVAMSAIER